MVHDHNHLKYKRFLALIIIMPKGIAAGGIVYLVFASPHHWLDLRRALLHSYCQSQLHGGRCNFSGFFLLVDC